MKHPLQPQILPATSAEQLAAIAELAGRIWRAHYPGIISSEQIEFMLARMYSLETLLDEVRSQGIHFYTLAVDGQTTGFASIGPTSAPHTWKLHKLYLLPERHGCGLGSLLLRHCEAEAIRLGAQRIILSVNKRNLVAVAAYERNGFMITESVVTDIGGGFVMDDFIMAKELSEARSLQINEKTV